MSDAGFTANTKRHFGGDLGQVLTGPLSHADVYSGVQAAIAALAALRAKTIWIQRSRRSCIIPLGDVGGASGGWTGSGLIVRAFGRSLLGLLF